MDRTETAKRKHPLRDRKSTRLNSSHSQISYAVFCLKKKEQLVGGGEEDHRRDDGNRTRDGVVDDRDVPRVLHQHDDPVAAADPELPDDDRTSSTSV